MQYIFDCMTYGEVHFYYRKSEEGTDENFFTIFVLFEGFSRQIDGRD